MTPGLCKPMSELFQIFQLIVGLKQHLEFYCVYCLQSNHLDRADKVSMNTAIKQLITEILALYLFQLWDSFFISQFLSMHLLELNCYC